MQHSTSRTSSALAFAALLVAAAAIAQSSPPLSGATAGPGAGATSRPATPTANPKLSVDGDIDLAGNLFQGVYPFLHNDGNLGLFSFNTAAGINAMVNLTTGGTNTALGSAALYATTTGGGNVAAGSLALYTNTVGNSNTAVGSIALFTNLDGYKNSAFGFAALQYNTSGAFNTALGEYAMNANESGERNTAVGRGALLDNLTGGYNVAIGHLAGLASETGSSNIFINSFAGATNESNTLRVGTATGTDPLDLDRVFIAGIQGADGFFTEAVCVKNDDQLGPCDLSSLRFKQDVGELGEASAGVFDLRPVRFRYRPSVDSDPERPVRFGLIAEEVAELYPNLVTYDAEGRPRTVRYASLTPLLLNELQKQNREVQRLNWLVGIMMIGGVAVGVGRWRFG